MDTAGLVGVDGQLDSFVGEVFSSLVRKDRRPAQVDAADVAPCTAGRGRAGGRDIEEALALAERSSEDLALGLARFTLGIALVHRDSPAEREHAPAVLGQVRDMCPLGRFYLPLLAVVDMCTARERARSGDRDGAIPLLREVVDDLFHAGQLWSCIGATAFLVETLLERGTDGDVAEAEAAITRLADAPADDGLVIREIWLLRLRRAVDMLTSILGMSQRLACKAVGLARSTHRRLPQALTAADPDAQLRGRCCATRSAVR